MTTRTGKRQPPSRRPTRRSAIRRWWGVGVVAVAVAVVVIVALSRSDHGGSAVTVQGGPPGNQLHTFDGNDHAPFISLADYKPIYDRHDPNYVLVDVREAGERAGGKIPGDIWAPLADADTTAWQFLEAYKDKTLVLYCDCPWAEAAKESVILKAHGFSYDRLRVLHEGIPGWQQAGYPVVPGGDACHTERNWPQACGR